jgi:SAM-dependent methyltransferase
VWLPIHEIIVDMESDPTKRFSARVENYVKYRPSYPDEIVPLLQRKCGLRPDARIADIGSGTGLLAQLFLRFGCEVFGVEPNTEMREAGERLMAREPRFHSVRGRAEATGLAEASVDLVTAGQAFHWFERDAAKREFRRIVRPPGWVVLVWNDRSEEGRFLREYEELLHRSSPDYEQVGHRYTDAKVLDSFFGAGAWSVDVLPNEQKLDLTALLGRLHSSSYAPLPGSEAYERLNAEMTRLFGECQEDGVVAFRYWTKVYCGRVGTAPFGLP